MIEEKDLDLYTSMATRLGRVEAKLEIMEKQNEKIEKLVESNYALSNSIQLLTDQVGAYDKKAEMLLNQFETSKEDVYNRIDEEDEKASNCLNKIADLEKVAEDYKVNIQKINKKHQEEEMEGYNTFKSFMGKLNEKTQAAFIAAIVAVMGYLGMHFVEYLIKILMEK